MRILGLDIGSASIGWALVDDFGDHGAIIASGSRIFPEGVDRDTQGGEQSKSQSRREARGARRQHSRRARRKRMLRKALQSHNLLPSDTDQLEQVIELNPYPLRARALDERLELFELGRVFMHLAQRRGFKSNRKTDKAKANDTKGMLAEINSLAGRIEITGCRTLGEYLSKIGTQEIVPADSEPVGIRNRHTRRNMYEHEFEAIFNAQKLHYPEILTSELFDTLGKDLIFFQRDMYWPMSAVGACDLERRSKRCPIADRAAQRFRIVQEVNNLRLIDRSTGEERGLSPEERSVVIDELAKSKERSFDQIRKKLRFTEQVRFNLERDDGGGRDKLKGHLVDSTLAGKKALGKEYWKLDESTKDRIVSIVISDKDEDKALGLLETKCGLTKEQAECALGAHLPDGYASYSKIAINKLIPFLETGMLVMGNDTTDSALHAAGYLRPDQLSVNREDALPQAPDLPNPIVRQALHEVRKVVNGIIREHCGDLVKAGKAPFDEIHVELAREAKQSADRRTKSRIDNAKRRRMREDAANEVENAGVRPTRSTINTFLLWQEQDRTCVYSGRPISLQQLLSETVDVDHILPRWRSLDDSMMNKVVVFREQNAAKGNKTPFEWLADSEPDRFNEILLRARKLPYPKYLRFIRKEIVLDHFVKRQLVDTQYISRRVTEYLSCLVDKPQNILTPRGSMTAELRRRWELNNILSDSGEKTRADHRHHAVDALVVALINRKRLHALANARGKGLLCPWEDLRNQAEVSIMNITVSHRVQRRISGALHEETLYGPTSKPLREQPADTNRQHAKDWIEEKATFVRRKSVSEIKNAKHLYSKVRDKGIQRILTEHLRAQGVDPEQKGAYPKGCFEGDNAPAMPSGVPIKRVRMLENKNTLRPAGSQRPMQFVQPGNNHHIVYRESTNKKGDAVWIGEVVTMWDAAQRGRTKINGKSLPLVDQSDNATGRFVLSLSKGESFVIDDPKGDRGRIRCVVRKIDQVGLMHYKEHTDAREVSELTPLNLYVSPKKMCECRARKITVTPLGQIRWASD